MRQWSTSRWVGVSIALIALHLIVLFAVSNAFTTHASSAYNQNGVTDGYDQLADNLLHGHGYRFYPQTALTMMREPGFPVFLAGLGLLFGPAFTVIKTANVLMAFATAGLLVLLSRRLWDDLLVAYIAPILFLLHPGVLLAECRGGLEILYGLLTTLLLLLLYKCLENGKWGRYILAGSVLGITVLVRSVLMFFPLFWGVYLLVGERRRSSVAATVRNMALMILFMFVFLSPWIIRNYSLTKKFVPTASVMGVSAHAGQYIDTHLFSGKPWWLLDREAARERAQLATDAGFRFEDDFYYQTFYQSADELKFSKFLLNRVIGEYRQHPLLFVKCVGLNLVNFWIAGKTWLATAINLLVQLPYLVLGFLGLRIAIRRGLGKIVAPLLLFMAYTIAVYAPILAQARYSIPLIPFVSIFAAIYLCGLLDKRNTEEQIEMTVESAGVMDERGRIADNEDEQVLVTQSRAGKESYMDLRPLAGVQDEIPSQRNDVQISFVIPAYNEQNRLPRTVLETIDWCSAQKLDYEIVIADDGSQDETLKLARLFEARDSRVRSLACPHMGKGSAVRMGMLNARGRYILFMDADGATPLAETQKLLSALESGYDVAIGSRALPGEGEVKVRTSIHRRIIGRVFAFFVNLFAIQGIADTQCGFKMFSHGAAMEIFSRQKTLGFAFDVEALFIARQLSLSVCEVPVNWVAQPGSKVNLVSDSIRMLWDISRIRWQHLRFRHNVSLSARAVEMARK